MVSLAKLRPQVSRTVALPIAVGGWDASSPIAEIPPERAIDLVNMFPKATSVVTRGGWDAWIPGGLGGATETLMPWNGVSSSKLFSANSQYVNDVTTQTAFTVFSGMTNAQWQFVNFGTSGGHFLWICNGADAPRYTNGTTWTVAALTGAGFNAVDIINVTAHQRRLFVLFKNSTAFGYLAPASIAGAVSLFDLSPLLKRGGTLMAIGSWTHDGGAGPDDYAVFVSSEGEAVVYAGTDPNSPSTWTMVGVFNVGQPIGRRCLLKYGTDMLMISQHGVVSLSRVIAAAEAERENVGITMTARIRDAYDTAAIIYGLNSGWQLIDHAPTNALYLNVPLSISKTEQYVMNALTGAWTRYTGINALCWTNRNGVLYAGQPGGSVARCFVTETDNNIAIPWVYRGAYIPIGKAGQSAHVKMLRPVMQSSADIVASFIVNTDFDETLPAPPVSHQTGGIACIWDEGFWDEHYWGEGPAVVRNWLETPAYGSRFSVQINGQSRTSVEILNFDALLEPGSIYG